MNRYNYNLRYQHTSPSAGKKVKERVCTVSVPYDKWRSGQYNALEKWLAGLEGGGDITIIDVTEA